MSKTITSANATCFVTVDGIFSSPQQLQGFGTDAALEMDDFAPVEVQMGIDGHLSGGWVPTPKVIKVTLAADSPSRQLMQDWLQYQEQARETYPCTMVFTVPSLALTYTGTRGFITGGKNMPSAKKTLEASTFTVTFESWVGAGL